MFFFIIDNAVTNYNIKVKEKGKWQDYLIRL